jgi:glycosyltransferase involved in cell wall biosynthesis
MSLQRVALMAEATSGGVRRHLTTLAIGLQAAGLETTVLAALRRDPAFGEDIRLMRQSGIRVVVLPMVRSISPVRDAFSLMALLRVIRPGTFDLLHTHSSKAGFLGRVVGRVRGMPLLVHSPHLFAFSVERQALRRVLYRRLEHFVAPFTTRFICVCEEEKAQGVRAGLGSADRFCVIPNGMPDECFARRTTDRRDRKAVWGVGEGEFLVGTVGRLVEQKGHRVLIEAAAQLRARGVGLHVAIVGEGPWRRRLEQEIRRQGLADRVRLVGRMDRPDYWTRAFDLFVLPSLWEGLPYALLEAMAAGLPVVATRTGGIAEALAEGKAGWLVPAGDAAALAEAIHRLAADPTLRETLGREARQRAWAHYRAQEMVARHIACYRSLQPFSGCPR